MTQPDVVKEFLCPVPSTLKNSIIQFRESFSNDIHNPIPSSRFIITGPREVNDHHQAIACSYWLLNKSNLSISDSIINAKKSPDKIQKLYSSNNTPLKNLKLAMNLDISGEIKASNSSYMAQTAFHGVLACRVLLMTLASHIPIIGDISDPIGLEYFKDLFGCGMVGPGTIESQVHRELASGVPFPIGFSSSSFQSVFSSDILNHKVQKAIDAILASADPHYFLSVTKFGNVAITSTSGNKDSFLVIPIQYNSMVLGYDYLVGVIDGLLEGVHTPKIALDVGKVSSVNLREVLELLEQILRALTLRNFIIGFMIDSGDRYVPDNIEGGPTRLQITQDGYDSLDEKENFSVMSENIGIKRPSMRNKIFTSVKSSYSKIRSTLTDKRNSDVSQYQDLIYADILINEIDQLIENLKT